ncbi:MAG: hypothetical protein IJ054_02200 [Lachnospiraceae bacterium]|nr:hypothetical protein [Lachnospiraceae bacterium]MBQ9233744.1 hypothetical protein [Lachnospiraceae bacterium]
MVNPVIIKGNNQGIRLIFSSEASFDEIKQELDKKLRSSKHYYSNVKPIEITFDGKKLTEDEKKDLLALLKNKGLNIDKKTHTETNESEQKSFTDLQPDKDGLFYIGNLKAGQSIDAATSIIIVGNIEQGASVISKGNIIVIGELNGYAKAGAAGSKNAFVYNVNQNTRRSCK